MHARLPAHTQTSEWHSAMGGGRRRTESGASDISPPTHAARTLSASHGRTAARNEVQCSAAQQTVACAGWGGGMERQSRCSRTNPPNGHCFSCRAHHSARSSSPLAIALCRSVTDVIVVPWLCLLQVVGKGGFGKVRHNAPLSLSTSPLLALVGLLGG